MTDVVLAHVAAPSAAWLLPTAAVLAPALLYLAGVGRLREAGRRWSSRRTGSFLTGSVLLGLALSPPLEAAAADARGHMAQHLLLGMYAPIALALGAPATLLLSAVPVPARQRVATVLRSRALHGLSHVGTAAVVSVGGLYLLYLTPLYALSTRSSAVHLAVHAHFLLAGYLFAWAVAGPDPAPRRSGTGVRLGVLVVAGGAHAFLAKLMYSRAPAWPPGSGHSTAEIESAAQWMYWGGHLADLLLLAALLAGWYRRTGRAAARDSELFAYRIASARCARADN